MTDFEKDYQKLFQLFTATDKSNPFMAHPFRKGNYCCATDGCSMIVIPVSMVDHEIEDVTAAPDVNRLIAGLHQKESISIRVKDLRNRLIPELIDEVVPKMVAQECPECCHEFNKVITFNTGHKIPNPVRLYSVAGVRYSYRLLSRLIDACQILDLENITQTEHNILGINIFQCGSALIALMPCESFDYAEELLEEFA